MLSGAASSQMSRSLVDRGRGRSDTECPPITRYRTSASANAESSSTKSWCRLIGVVQAPERKGELDRGFEAGSRPGPVPEGLIRGVELRMASDAASFPSSVGLG